MNRRSLFSLTLAALTGGLIAKDLPATPTMEGIWTYTPNRNVTIDSLFAQDAAHLTGAIDAAGRSHRPWSQLIEKDTLPAGMGFNWNPRSSASSSQPAA